MQKDNISRRSFLRLIGWGSFFAATGISVAGALRFLFPRVLFEKPSAFKISVPAEFKGGPDYQVFENWKAEHSVWLVRERNRIYAVHAKCTHLGCTPNWFPDEGIFKCPCHGSQFHKNGMNFAGPAPRPLDRLNIAIDDDGNIVIDKSRVYTFKEFDKQGAYVEV
ncbi:MAG: ubiquinol-cytochrome c reductase iron-sulfur subunit [Nitrospirae bacterium]|nr:ubiquinol-cytochrome c reductase iron-sulfur subunit [Nitrospirota bacterium]